MKFYRLIVSLSLLCLSLIACTNEPNSSVLELTSPTSNRTGLVDAGDWEYQVDITVNSGPIQTFYFDPTESSMSVVIVGIRPNEENSIEILWKAVIDGLSVNLSRQSQVFIADGNTVIDAQHNPNDYDYDGDGASNLFELAAGTCLWSAEEPCIHPNLIDTDSSNLLTNGDFSNGTDGWWSTQSLGVVVDGEFCMSVLPSQVNRIDWHLGQLPKFDLSSNTSYSLSFYARSQVLGTMNASVLRTLPDYSIENVYVTNVEVFSTFNFYRYQFNTTDGNYDNTSLVFNFDASMDNYICFDDVVLEKASGE